jgi:hypothetical protein
VRREAADVLALGDPDGLPNGVKTNV